MASTESEKFNEYLNMTGYEMLLIHEYRNSVISVWPDDLAVIYCLHVGGSGHSVIHYMLWQCHAAVHAWYVLCSPCLVGSCSAIGLFPLNHKLHY